MFIHSLVYLDYRGRHKLDSRMTKLGNLATSILPVKAELRLY